MTQRSDFHAALRLAFLLEAQDDLPDVLEVAASTASVRRKGRRVTSLRCISLCSGTIFNFQTHPSPPIHSIKYSATRRLGYHAANTSTVLLVQGLEGHWEDDVWSFLILFLLVKLDILLPVLGNEDTLFLSLSSWNTKRVPFPSFRSVLRSPREGRGVEKGGRFHIILDGCRQE
mmetsp:Transcript_2898/g.4520  ORF Transcript_2898/g.4520 Transcript_2898/m.4520 type:complete len:174 (-) Transcript_2898:695-1216(-)